MSETVIESVPLHDYPEYRDGCVEVLCEEWGRSRSARLVMLEKSNQKFPYNIALLERLVSNAKQVNVIGHSRLCRVFGQPEAAFVESEHKKPQLLEYLLLVVLLSVGLVVEVVVRKRKRNQGLGRKLMNETEQHARRLGITTLYLSTHDKQDFYNHLGYEYCTPVVSSGAASAFLTEKLSLLVGCYETPPKFKNNFPNSTEDQLTFDTEVGETPTLDIECKYSRDFDEVSEAQSETESINQDENDPTELTVRPRSSQPPPPPPPTPLASRAASCDRKEVTTRISVFWMKKELIS